MFRKYLAITILGLLTQHIGIGMSRMHSPCPTVFQYIRSQNTGDIEGRIEIHGASKGTVLQMVVKLSVAVALPTKYVGKLELAVLRDVAIQAVQQGRPLLYRLQFPLQRPVPFVTRILFNQRERCSGRRAIGPIVTSITLEHSLFPPGINTSMSTSSLPTPNVVPVQYWNLPPVPASTEAALPDQISTPVTEPPLKPNVSGLPPQDLVQIENCGRPGGGNVNLLIAKGDRTQPGDWPWLVAIFVSRIQLEFQCAGSLVSNRHVITAAHCLMSSDGQALPANTLLAVVGRYRLRNWAERGSVTHEVSGFRVHTEYGLHGASYDYDLAVVILMEKAMFGKLVMPICLWSGPPGIDSIVGKTGVVVGWGRDEQGNPVTVEPRISRVPIVSQEECLRSNKDFVDYTSNRTFCGGARNGSGPCNGDSGGGLVMYDVQNQRYHLRGVVSLSLLDRETGVCDLSQFVVYTDIAKYMVWVQEQIAS